jgi:hypothetical protein
VAIVSSDLVAALIAGGSALGGGLVVGVSKYVINRAQAHDAHKAELRRVFSTFLNVILRIDYQLRIEPRPGKTVQVVNEQMESRLPWFDYSIGRIRRQVFEPHPDTLVDRWHESMAATILIAPLESFRHLRPSAS